MVWLWERMCCGLAVLVIHMSRQSDGNILSHDRMLQSDWAALSRTAMVHTSHQTPAEGRGLVLKSRNVLTFIGVDPSSLSMDCVIEQ